MGKRTEKHIIGWSEHIDLPEWSISGIEVKVDTGARTSALHVEELRDLGDGTVRFVVVLGRKGPHQTQTIIAPVTKWARVKSSTGVSKLRCFVKTRMRLGPVEKDIEISLVSREKMMFRMLLGRKAMEHDFLVDVSQRRHLSDRPRKMKKPPVNPLKEPRKKPSL